MIGLKGIHTILGFLEHIIQNPEDKAGLKLAGDIVQVMQTIAQDPRLPQLETDVGAYMALVMPPAPAAAPAPEVDPPSSEQPTNDRSDHSHGSLMNPAA